MRMKKMIATIGLVTGLSLTLPGSMSWGASWRGAMDDSGTMWARVKIVNQSAYATSWAVWDCRTAVASTDNAVLTDFEAGWDTLVDAGATEYVWVYGNVRVQTEEGDVSQSEFKVSIASEDGVAYRESNTAEEAGDGEWVITVSADGTVSASIESLGTPYDVPTRSSTSG